MEPMQEQVQMQTSEQYLTGPGQVKAQGQAWVQA